MFTPLIAHWLYFLGVTSLDYILKTLVYLMNLASILFMLCYSEQDHQMFLEQNKHDTEHQKENTYMVSNWRSEKESEGG